MKKAAVHIPSSVMNFRNQKLQHRKQEFKYDETFLSTLNRFFSFVIFMTMFTIRCFFMRISDKQGQTVMMSLSK